MQFQFGKSVDSHRYRTELLLILRLANERNQLLCILLPRYCFRQRHLQSISAAVGVKQRAAAASPFSIAIELTTVLFEIDPRVLKVAAAALYSVRGTMPHSASEPAHEQKSQASSSSKRSSSSDSASQEPQKRKKQKLKLMQDSGQTKARAAH
eukprot:17815-Heterococcus_DN1.PRE.2